MSYELIPTSWGSFTPPSDEDNRKIWDGFYRPHRKLICHAACRAGLEEAEAEEVAVEACRTLAAALMTAGVDFRKRGLKARLAMQLGMSPISLWQATNRIRRQVKAELERSRRLPETGVHGGS